MAKLRQAEEKNESSKDEKSSDEQNFNAIGIIFFVTGLALMVGDVTRAVGIPFLILGGTFFALGHRPSGEEE